MDTLDAIEQDLGKLPRMGEATRLEFLKKLSRFGEIKPLEQEMLKEPESTCPVHREPLRLPCGLSACRYWVEQPWVKNCALNFMSSQSQQNLSVNQVSLLYRKSPVRVDSIFRRCFKVIQRHYLKDLIHNRGYPRFQFLTGFCVDCESKLTRDEILNPSLRVGFDFGYCSPECRKSYQPHTFDLEYFFQTRMENIVKVGAEFFNVYALEEILGFQANVLRARLEKSK